MNLSNRVNALHLAFLTSIYTTLVSLSHIKALFCLPIKEGFTIISVPFGTDEICLRHISRSNRPAGVLSHLEIEMERESKPSECNSPVETIPSCSQQRHP